MSKEIMTVVECAKYLSVEESTIKTWIKTRGLPYRSIGKFYRFRLSEIDIWFDGFNAEKITGCGGVNYKYLVAWRKRQPKKQPKRQSKKKSQEKVVQP